MAPGYWTATLHFAIPYAKWGMKNSSTLFLRVSESVDIDLTASGGRDPALKQSGIVNNHPAERSPYPQCIRNFSLTLGL